jgi:hypothetical protein
MRFLSPFVHQFLDFGTVGIFAAAPALLDIGGNAARLSYALAIVHGLMTLVTHFPGNRRGFLPYRLHVAVEVAVGAVLIMVGAFVFPAQLWFYCGMGALILVIAALSFLAAQKPRPRTATG